MGNQLTSEVKTKVEETFGKAKADFISALCEVPVTT